MWREGYNGRIEVVNERPTIVWVNIEEAGSCMGCNRRGIRKVNKLTSPNGTEIRLCGQCVKEIRNAT